MGRPFQSLVIGFYLGRVAGATFFVACMYFALRLVQGRFDRY